MCDNTDITTLTQVRPFKGHWTCPLMERNFLFLGLSECLALLEWDFPLHIGMKYIQLMQNMSPSQFINYWWGGQPTQSEFGSFQFPVFVITTAGASVCTAGCSPAASSPPLGCLQHSRLHFYVTTHNSTTHIVEQLYKYEHWTWQRYNTHLQLLVKQSDPLVIVM